LAVDAAREQGFLGPLPVTLLPLAQEAIQRLHFLGLRTLGQYAALPAAAVWQQFGRAGKRAHRYAQGKDDRPVVSRHQERTLSAQHTFEVPADTRERLLAALKHVTDPLLDSLRGRLQACGQVRLAMRFDDGSAQEKTRTFLVPVSDSAQVNRALGSLLDMMRWPAGAVSVSVGLAQIQEAMIEQLTFLPSENEHESKIREVQRYLAARFGASRLWRAALVSPSAPLPEWRVTWRQED
jgi:nucleotidyltransferase/DNA polymerase involved in DNA repair